MFEELTFAPGDDAIEVARLLIVKPVPAVSDEIVNDPPVKEELTIAPAALELMPLESPERRSAFVESVGFAR